MLSIVGVRVLFRCDGDLFHPTDDFRISPDLYSAAEEDLDRSEGRRIIIIGGMELPDLEDDLMALVVQLYYAENTLAKDAAVCSFIAVHPGHFSLNDVR